MLITGLWSLQREALQEIWNRTLSCSFLWSLTLLPQINILLGLVCKLFCSAGSAHEQGILCPFTVTLDVDPAIPACTAALPVSAAYSVGVRLPLKHFYTTITEFSFGRP